MFKLESYITPILLSYVDKYIKNFRPEDSQVKQTHYVIKYLHQEFIGILMGWRCIISQFGFTLRSFRARTAAAI